MLNLDEGVIAFAYVKKELVLSAEITRLLLHLFFSFSFTAADFVPPH